MAQRRRAGEAAGLPSTLLFRMAPLLLLFADRAHQAEEGQSVPARACHFCRNRAERGKEPVLIPEALSEDFDQNGSSFPLAREQAARHGQPAVLLPLAPFAGDGFDYLAGNGEEVRRRDFSQLGIIGDLLCPLASPHREISFGSRLQAPGDLSEEMLAMARARLLPKHLAILLTESCY